MARKKKAEPPENHERWMVSYADFMTLLFATFTALFAISNADKAKFEAMAKSMKLAFTNGAASVIGAPNAESSGGSNAGDPLVVNIFPDSPSPPPPARPAQTEKRDDKQDEQKDEEADDPLQGVALFKGDENNGDNPEPADGAATPTPTPTPPPPLSQGIAAGTEGGGNEAMAAELKAMLDGAGLKDKIEVRQELRGTVISLGEAAFFAPGATDVLPVSRFQLSQIVNVLRGKNYEIRIEGHTDNTPVASGRYRSNFELSTMRATRILEFMVKEFNFSPESLSAAGYGEGRPVADNSTNEGRQKNRRVDIVILNQKGAAGEPHPQTATATSSSTTAAAPTKPAIPGMDSTSNTAAVPNAAPVADLAQ